MGMGQNWTDDEVMKAEKPLNNCARNIIINFTKGQYCEAIYNL